MGSDGRPIVAWLELHRRLRAGHDFSSSEVLLALTLCGFMGRPDDHGRFTAWPSIATMARLSGLDERSVRRVLKRHQARGDRLFTVAGRVLFGSHFNYLYVLPFDAAGEPVHIVPDLSRGLLSGDRASCPVNPATDRALRPVSVGVTGQGVTGGRASCPPGDRALRPSSPGTVPTEVLRKVLLWKVQKKKRRRALPGAYVSPRTLKGDSLN